MPECPAGRLPALPTVAGRLRDDGDSREVRGSVNIRAQHLKITGIVQAAGAMLGIFSARLSRLRPLTRGIRMAVIGGGAVALGVFVSKVVMASL